MTKALRPGGIITAKEFIFDEGRTFGPRGLTEQEIRTVLSPPIVVKELTKSSFWETGPRNETFFVLAEML